MKKPKKTFRQNPIIDLSLTLFPVTEDLILTFLFYLALFVANSDYVLGLFLTMTTANGLGIYLHTSHSYTTLRLNFCFNTKFPNL